MPGRGVQRCPKLWIESNPAKRCVLLRFAGTRRATFLLLSPNDNVRHRTRVATGVTLHDRRQLQQGLSERGESQDRVRERRAAAKNTQSNRIEKCIGEVWTKKNLLKGRFLTQKGARSYSVMGPFAGIIGVGTR
jgi:hypothetical protein